MANKTIKQVVAEGRLKRYLDPRLVKALGHPIREHVLAVLNERIASASEVGKEVGLEVEDFYHHVEWEAVPSSLRSDLMVNFIQLFLDDVIAAVDRGTFAKNDAHLTWLPGIFDALGWSEAVALMNEMSERAMAIQGRCVEGIAKTGEPGTPATIAIMGFEAGAEFGQLGGKAAMA